MPWYLFPVIWRNPLLHSLVHVNGSVLRLRVRENALWLLDRESGNVLILQVPFVPLVPLVPSGLVLLVPSGSSLLPLPCCSSQKIP